MLPLLILNSLVIIGLLLFVVFILRHLQKSVADVDTKVAVSAANGVAESFVPLLVHELRAPVSVIKGASDLMLKDAHTLSAEQIQTLLSQIRSSSDSLLRVIGNILDVSKMENGRFEILKTPGDYAAMLKEEVAYFDAPAHVKGITLALKLNQTPINFKFDTERIKQVLNNLLTNALKFTPAGGNILIEAKIDNQTKKVVTSVSDTGDGVPKGERPKLFHKFVQGSNQSNTREKGSGLGLVIAKGIVEAHNGKIWIEDSLPHGAKLIFTLPYEV